MLALITGASSGIGYDMSLYLDKLGYDLILVARNKNKLEELKSKLNNKSEIIICDLSNKESVLELYNKTKDKDIDILINNAGFGDLGFFNETDINKEIDMINTNIISLHILTKLFISDFIKKDKGYILNVSSSASFTPGPLMATYYSTKAYVTHLTLALSEELRKQNSKVKISCLCPGPVNTNFNNIANCEFKVKGLSSEYVARYSIDKMFKNKLIIIPGFSIKLVYFFLKFIPLKLRLRFAYKMQKNKVR